MEVLPDGCPGLYRLLFVLGNVVGDTRILILYGAVYTTPAVLVGMNPAMASMFRTAWDERSPCISPARSNLDSSGTNYRWTHTHTTRIPTARAAIQRLSGNPTSPKSHE